ncbi:MAG: hypothetical protein IIZ61_08845 [Lachnospiraceae bacterium]|nr:hypothetical protein [Lachnospiraceae bacterium]
MLNISELHLASIIMDAAALFILIGMMVYTGIYRKRGHFDDKLFSSLILITIIMAASDCVTYVLDGSTVPFSATLSMFCNNVFFIAFELYAGMMAVYMDYRLKKSDKPYLTRGCIIMIPAVATSLAIIANNFVNFLFWVDPATNEYVEYPLYNIVFIAPFIYAAIVTIAVIKIDASSVWVLILLILARTFSRHFLQGVSSTAVVFAIGLVFLHLHYMRHPFYEEFDV